MSNITVVDGWPVLNPHAPSSFVPPQVASELDLVTYFCVGTAGVYVWDLLNTLPQDYKIIAKQGRLRLPTFIYFFSKLATLAFVLSSTIYQTAPISNCLHSLNGVATLFVFAMPSTSLLFFLRARAVFLGNPFATALFGVLWLGVLGGSVSPITAFIGVNVGPTRYCTIGIIKFYSITATITPLINDTIVFFAISWRLSSNTRAMSPTLRTGVRTMVFGDHLPSFSKSLLQDGQVYFLTTVGANIVTVIMLFATAVPDPLRALPSIPNTALMNIMAGRLYRKTLLTGFSSSSHQSSSNPVSLSLMVGTPSSCSSGPKKATTTDNSFKQMVDVGTV